MQPHCASAFSVALILWSSFLITNNDAFSCKSSQRLTTSKLSMIKSTRSRTRTNWEKKELDRMVLHEHSSDDDDHDKDQSLLIDSSVEDQSVVMNRRSAFTSVVSALVLGGSSITMAARPNVAQAFDKTFPMELTESDAAVQQQQQQSNREGISLTATQRYSQGSRSNSMQRAADASAASERNKKNIANFNIQNDFIPSIIWGSALWLLSGSRSNPIVTPVANIVYDESKESWLQDRNSGLFADLPIPLYIVLTIIFCILGIMTQYLLLQLLQGDSDVTLQWAEVSVLTGGFLELGRIASGEKLVTREENNRDVLLQNEFQQFAKDRLQVASSNPASTNCHRSDVVSAFRRYYGKYRQADSEQYPLTDLEIEKLLRAWNLGPNRGRAEMTSSGFYYGISINKDADAFV